MYTREIMNSCHVDLVACHSAHDLLALVLQHEHAEACPAQACHCQEQQWPQCMQMAESGCGGCIVHTRTVGPFIYIPHFQAEVVVLARTREKLTIMYTYIIFL